MKTRISVTTYWLILSVTIAGLWPVWRWYGLRALSDHDESRGLLAIFTVLVFLYVSKPQRHPALLKWSVPVVLITLYVVFYKFLPPLLRAFIAMGLLSNLISQYWFNRHFHAGISALLMLSLPVAASLQFYLGYPMRVAAGSVTEVLLQLNGLSVARQGTILNWGSRVISIDAPCSGVKMLWVSCYLAGSLSCVLGLSAGRTLALFSGALFVVICANVFRSAALFYLESGILPMQSWMHQGVGLFAFLFAASAIAWCGWFIRGKPACLAT